MLDPICEIHSYDIVMEQSSPNQWTSWSESIDAVTGIVSLRVSSFGEKVTETYIFKVQINSRDGNTALSSAIYTVVICFQSLNELTNQPLIQYVQPSSTTTTMFTLPTYEMACP